MATTLKKKSESEVKKLSISSKRQVTIPKKFFSQLNFSTDAECMIRGNELIIRPSQTKSGGEFAEQILADLIQQGYSGEELLQRFSAIQKEIRPAVQNLLHEAKMVAEDRAPYDTYQDVFGEDEGE